MLFLPSCWLSSLYSSAPKEYSLGSIHISCRGTLLYLSNILLLLSLIGNDCDATVQYVRPPQKLAASNPKSSVISISKQFAPSASVQTNNRSRIVSSATSVVFHPQDVDYSNAALPPPFDGADSSDWENYHDILDGYCDMGDDFCSFKHPNGTIIKATPEDRNGICLLWDSSCSGNKTLAEQLFFEWAFLTQDVESKGVFGNRCFAEAPGVYQSDCEKYNPPDRLSDWQKIRNWMRTPQCVSDAEEWQNRTGHQWRFFYQGVDEYSPHKQLSAEEGVAAIDESHSRPEVNPSCCQVCDISAQNVDLYYWPEPDANQSCLSIVGEAVKAIDDGATIDSSHTFWACNSTDPSIPTTVQVTTAEITNIGGLQVKVPLFNPWSSPCMQDQARNRSGLGPIVPRDHSLIIPSTITPNSGLPVSTVVSGNFTL